MAPTFDSGDLLWVEPCDQVDALGVGDVAVVEIAGQRYAHRVIALGVDPGGWLITRGDACAGDDGRLPAAALRGRAVGLRRQADLAPAGPHPDGWQPVPAAPSPVQRTLRLLRARAAVGLSRLGPLAAGLQAVREAWAGWRPGSSPAPAIVTVEARRQHLAAVASLLTRLRVAHRPAGLPELDELLAGQLRVAQAHAGALPDRAPDASSAGASFEIPVLGVIALVAPDVTSAGPRRAMVRGPWVGPSLHADRVAARLVVDLCQALAAEPGGCSWELTAVPVSQAQRRALEAASFVPVAGLARPGVVMVRRLP
jgi:hypothetical protein